MSGIGVAVRYATALLEVAAEQRLTASVEADIRSMRRILAEVPGVREYCLRLRPRRELDMTLVETAFVPYLGELTANTLRTAVRNGRVAALPFIPDAFERVAARRSDTVAVSLETARPADPELLRSVEARMSRRTGRTVALRARVVPELLGGMRITWENRVLDLSAAGRAKKLRSVLLSE